MSAIVSSIIPVIDLMIGQVVWAKGGNRDAYRPLQSRLTNSSNPLDVAQAIFAQTGCDWLYIADIDSFAGANPAWSVFETLTEAGFKLMIDANWPLEDRINQAIDKLAGTDNIKLIVSTETLSSIEQFKLFTRMTDAGIVPVFSLDMKGADVIAHGSEIADATPLELVHQAWQAGVRHMIQLDLTTVGLHANDDGSASSDGHHQHERLMLLSEIANELPEMCLISGGGMRNHADCQEMLSSGCQHVLAASAIYNGKLTPDEIAELKPFRCSVETRAAYTCATRNQ